MSGGNVVEPRRQRATLHQHETHPSPLKLQPRRAIRDSASKPDARCGAGGTALRTHGKNHTQPPRSGQEYFRNFRGSVSAEMSTWSASVGTSTDLGFFSGGGGFCGRCGMIGACVARGMFSWRIDFLASIRGLYFRNRMERGRDFQPRTRVGGGRDGVGEPTGAANEGSIIHPATGTGGDFPAMRRGFQTSRSHSPTRNLNNRRRDERHHGGFLFFKKNLVPP